MCHCRNKSTGLNIEVNHDLCCACGLCATVCTAKAIWFLWGHAQIIQKECNLCGKCVKICPQKAIGPVQYKL